MFWLMFLETRHKILMGKKCYMLKKAIANLFLENFRGRLILIFWRNKKCISTYLYTYLSCFLLWCVGCTLINKTIPLRLRSCHSMFTRLGCKLDKYTYAMDGGMETCLAHVLHYLWEIFFWVWMTIYVTWTR